MTNTYTSNEISVTDGEITSHDTSKDDEINILNGQIRWKGSSIRVKVDDPNQDPADNGIVNENHYDFYDDNQNTWFKVNHPPRMEGYNTEFDKHVFRAHWGGLGPDVDHYQADVELEVYDSNDNLVVSKTGTTYYDDDLAYYPGPSYTTQTYHPDWWARSRFTNSTSVSSPGSGDDTAILETEIQSHYTEEIRTKDPYVTRDVDGSYTGTIEDGVWCNWQSLNGLATNEENEFYHNISGSGEATFQFRYDWEYVYPNAVSQFRLYDAESDVTHKVSLADPTDSALDYDVYRFNVNGVTLALDLVDPTDSNAIEWWQIYHPTHGTLCPRSYDTV